MKQIWEFWGLTCECYGVFKNLITFDQGLQLFCNEFGGFLLFQYFFIVKENFSAALALIVSEVLLNQTIELEANGVTEGGDQTLMAHIMRRDSALWKGFVICLL